MTIYAGLDVSDKTTHVCVVTGEGAIVRRDVVASDPEVLAKWLKKHCSGLVRLPRQSLGSLHAAPAVDRRSVARQGRRPHCCAHEESCPRRPADP